MSIRPVDRLRMSLMLAVRRVNRASIEHWSQVTYRRRGLPVTTPIEAVPVASQHGTEDAPAGLFVPRHIPPPLRLGPLYELPYYVLAGIAFKLYRRSPIPPNQAWDPSVHLDGLRSDEGWDDITEDGEFSRLRLQGPNPFLLERGEDDTQWICDYTRAFEGIHPPVRCSFRSAEGDMRPEAIAIHGVTHRPGDAGWQHAKAVANALDARLTVFGQHLLRTHLVVGQVFALSAPILPPTHPIRPFLDLHTYGTLHVNSYSWRLLLTPTSYFIQSHFIDRAQALQLMRNVLRDFHAEALDCERDLERRGLHRFPNHPYVENALPVWHAMLAYCRDVVETYADDDAIRNDVAIQQWHARLMSLFPNSPPGEQRLDTKEGLARVLCGLVFNNVVHEVSGDYSIYMSSRRPELKRLVNFEHVKDPAHGPVRLNDVFLFEQGAFAGMFNTAGNNMLATPIDDVIAAAHLRACVNRLRDSLRNLERTASERDAGKRFSFRRMRPSQWELSVSF